MNSNTKECFVAFIDVLGFKKMIDEDGGSGKKLKAIKDTIKKGTEDLRKRQEERDSQYKFWFDEFKIKSFSDCFCFSIPIKFEKGDKDYKQNFTAFYVWLMVFYNELLNKGFLCRGGMSQNWHYVDQDIIFSKGLIDAYKLESESAIYPMLLLDEKLLNKVRIKFNYDKISQYMFVYDNTGRTFLNPFNYSIVEELFFGRGDEEFLNKNINDRNKLLTKFLEIVDIKIKENFGKIFVDKYQWLKELILFVKDEKYSDKFTNGIQKKIR